MKATPAAPGVWRRPFEMSRFVDKMYEQWSRDAQDSFNEFRTDGVRGFDREEVLEQFTPAARRLAR